MVIKLCKNIKLGMKKSGQSNKIMQNYKVRNWNFQGFLGAYDSANKLLDHDNESSDTNLLWFEITQSSFI